ncbi:MAG: hypothetical protein U1D66_15275 [Erythrobacter sp.]|nr:hypothetical protein [Erythrobacter sp.]
MNAILSASRFQRSDEMIPRLREAADMTLDHHGYSKPGQVWTWRSGSVNLPSANQ